MISLSGTNNFIRRGSRIARDTVSSSHTAPLMQNTENSSIKTKVSRTTFHKIVLKIRNWIKSAYKKLKSLFNVSKNKNIKKKVQEPELSNISQKTKATYNTQVKEPQSVNDQRSNTTYKTYESSAKTNTPQNEKNFDYNASSTKVNNNKSSSEKAFQEGVFINLENLEDNSRFNSFRTGINTKSNLNNTDDRIEKLIKSPSEPDFASICGEDNYQTYFNQFDDIIDDPQQYIDDICDGFDDLFF